MATLLPLGLRVAPEGTMSLGWDCKAGSPERQKPCQQPGLGKLGRKADVAGEAEPAHRQQGLGHPLVTVTPARAAFPCLPARMLWPFQVPALDVFLPAALREALGP